MENKISIDRLVSQHPIEKTPNEKKSYLVYTEPSLGEELTGGLSIVAGLALGIGGTSLLYQNGLCSPEGLTAGWILPTGAVCLYWGFKSMKSSYTDIRDV